MGFSFKTKEFEIKTERKYISTVQQKPVHRKLFMAKLKEMRRQVAWFSTSVFSFAASLIIPYSEGRMNSIWVIPPLLPADLLPLLLLFLGNVVLLASWLRSRHFYESAGMFFIALTLLFACFTVDRMSFYQSGFGNYVKHMLTPDEWRSISKFAQQHIQSGEKLAGPNKNLWNEKNKTLWAEFSAATQVGKLDPSLAIYVHSNRTAIVWGGALMGHRSVIIYTSTNPVTNSDVGFKRIKFITQDIATIMD